jgi:protein dithiol:quinone oxidoreductase
VTRADLLLAGSAAASLAAVAAALLTQHIYGMQPCAWCVLQRLVFIAIAAACGLGLSWRAPPGRRAGAALAGLLALSGAAAALWQHFVAASAASCDLSLAERIVAATGLDERLPEVFMALASCAEAKVRLGGIPYEFWSLGLFMALAGAALLVWRRPR